MRKKYFTIRDATLTYQPSGFGMKFKNGTLTVIFSSNNQPITVKPTKVELFKKTFSI